MKRNVVGLSLLVCMFMFVSAMCAGAQEKAKQPASAGVAQIVALDECEPTSFNGALGPDFCKHVVLAALGFSTNLSDVYSEAAAGTPDPGSEFEPGEPHVKQGTTGLGSYEGREP